MIKKLIQEYGCDHQYCSATARIATGSMAYGTNYSKECQSLEKRGWAVTGLNHFCKAHKILYNWGTVTINKIKGDK